MKKTPLMRRTPLRAKKTRPVAISRDFHGGIPTVRPRKRRKKGEITKLKEKLWVLVRERVRAKYGNTCFTCGKGGLSGGNWQTGHFITSSTCSTEMRYAPENLRIQCYHCNINLSGNWVEFEKRLINEGVDVEALKRRNEETKGKKYDSLWYEQQIAIHRDRLQESTNLIQ